MPAWNEARRAGQRSRNKAQAERAAPSTSKVALPQAKERFEKQVCIYCQGKGGLRVGRLAITGNVYFCKKHKAQYESDKNWETKYKRETGL
jgi:hypothetical protein